MADYAYTKVHGRINGLMAKIRAVGVPNEVNNTWLKQIGFTSSNDRTLIAVLDQIGFIGPDKGPTDRWKEYRGANHERVLAQGIRDGYRELYDLYEDAHERPETELRSFFSTQTTAGAQVISAMVSTFKTLASCAEFTERSQSTKRDTESDKPKNVATIEGAEEPKPQGSAPVSVTINIQLTIPETKDDEVYDKFFAALKRHLLTKV